MNLKNETIAAIATGLTPSGIGIVRISGPESYTVCGKIFTDKSGKPVSFEKPNRIHYGFISPVSPGRPDVHSDTVKRETLDEVLVMNMKAPHSYTGEDTVEINCHGGPLMMRRILETVIAAGARTAEPGEFTKRAFLNGRIDLAQAEAVIDIINAKNDRAMKAGISQLKGNLSDTVKKIRETILGETAYIEAALDDPEHYDLTGFAEKFLPEIDVILDKIDRLTETFRYGKYMKEGINTCILGKPNAGKSSLLNALLGEERAIVTEIPGTTRDVIRESITIGSLTLNIMDTAGIRETEDRVEKIGVEKAFQYAKEADLVLYVIDASEEPDENDREIIRFIRENSCKALYILNKSDLTGKTDRAEIELLTETDRKINYSETGKELSAVSESTGTAVSSERRETKKNVSRETSLILNASAKNGTGIQEILKMIREMFDDGSIGYNDEVTVTSERHLELLKQAAASLRNVVSSVNSGLPEDFYTIDLMDAYHDLGMIIGEETEDDLADRIFADFCMGK